MTCTTAFKQSSIVLAGALILAEGAGLAQLATAQVNLKPVLGPSLPPLGQPFSPHKSVLLASESSGGSGKQDQLLYRELHQSIL
jgi:hypothetical protein